LNNYNNPQSPATGKTKRLEEQPAATGGRGGPSTKALLFIVLIFLVSSLALCGLVSLFFDGVAQARKPARRPITGVSKRMLRAVVEGMPELNSYTARDVWQARGVDEYEDKSDVQIAVELRHPTKESLRVSLLYFKDRSTRNSPPDAHAAARAYRGSQSGADTTAGADGRARGDGDTHIGARGRAVAGRDCLL
jgi:hypothetical protein